MQQTHDHYNHFLAPSASFSQNTWEWEKAFREAMHQKGVFFNGDVKNDGQFHRFPTGNKNNKDGWYVFYGMAGAFGDWRQGITETWSVNKELLPDQDKERLREQVAKAQQKSEEEQLRKYEETAAIAEGKWASLSEMGEAPYLIHKQVKAFGLRFNKDYLIIPIRDITGKLWSLQWIAPDRTKRFLSGGRKKGCSHTIGTLEDGKPIIIVEGYATGASIHMATQKTVVVAFDAGNLEPVIEELKKAYPNSPLVIAGDDDCYKETNMGREKAEEAAKKYGCSVIFPQFKNAETKPTDFNDLHVLEGLDVVKEQINQALKALEWPEPQPINNIKKDLLPVIPLHPQLIPEPYQPWLTDIAERMQCPLDYVAVGAVVVTSSLIGAGCGIRPKRLDSWTVIPNLWGGIVGDPSTLKSPALKEIMRPLESLEAEAREVYTKELHSYDTNSEAYKATREVIKKEMTKAASHMDHIAMELAKERLDKLLEPETPSCKRYSTNDATIEKMQELLSRNNRGLLLFRDELMGLLVDWERQGREGDRAFYLEAWNGYGSKTTDRIGRGTIHTQNLCVSLLGSTQPTKLLSYFERTLGGLENDGLLQRFQLLVYPDNIKNWRFVDLRPNDQAREQASTIMIKLATMDFSHYGGQIDPTTGIPYFHFDSQAQEVFCEWLIELEAKLHNSTDEPIIIEHLAKYRKLMPSLALIFHLINVASGKASGPVTLDCVTLAAGWCDYLESHARRIYGGTIDESCQSVRNLAKKIQEKEIVGSFDIRDIYRKQWSLLKTKEDVVAACYSLMEKGWLREKQTVEGGKIKTIYCINPKISQRG